MSSLTIYRRNGAVRFSADLLRGVIFISFARPISQSSERMGGRRYRWEEKITMALNPSEASSIGAFARLVLSGNPPRKTPEIVHTPERFGKKGPQKILKIEKRDEGTFFEMDVKSEKIVVGPIGFSDLYLIDSFLSKFIPEILPKPRSVPPPPPDETPQKEVIEEEREEEVEGEEPFF